MIPAKYRRVVYIIATAALSVVFAVGLVSPDQVSVFVDNASKAAGMVAAILALLNVTE